MSKSSVVSRSVVKCASLLSVENLGTLLAAACLLILPSAVWAQAATAHFGYVATVLPANGLVWPSAVAVDAAGDVFITDQNTGSISELVPGATSLVVIHTGLTNPEGIAVDGTGNLYVSQQGSASLTVYPVGGGNPTTLGSGLNQPIGLALDGLGNIYVADSDNALVKKIAISNGAVSNVGTGWSIPSGVALDAAGNLYVADKNTYSVVKVATNGVQSTVMYPLYAYGVAVDPSGNVFSSDSVGYTVQQVPLAGSQEQLVSNTASIDGTQLNQPEGMAVDSTGSVYLADLANGRVIKLQPSGVTFPVTAVGATSSPVTLTFTFDTGGFIGVPGVLTQGAPGLDFSDAGTGTCTTNGTSYTYNAGDACTVNVRFSPTAPRTRSGSAVLRSSGNSAIATAYLNGAGVGPQAVFPNTNLLEIDPSIYGNLNEPFGIAVDGAGNIYVADYNLTSLVVFPANCASTSCATSTVGDGFNEPTGVAIDGAGNLYVVDHGNGAIKEMPLNCADSTCVTTLGGGFNQPLGVAVDSSGNVYVSEAGTGRVLRMPPRCASSTCVAPIGGGFGNPQGLWVDGSGNVFVADPYPGIAAISKIPNGCISSACVVGLGGGFSHPRGVAVDGSGNIYIADTGSSTLKKMPGTCTTSACVTTLAGSGWPGVNEPYGVFMTSGNNLYVTDTDNHKIKEIDQTDGPNLSYSSTAVGASSAQQVVALSNYGNAPLTISALSGTNANFSGAGTTCAIGTPLAATASCNLGIKFAPTAVGAPLTGSANITGNGYPSTLSIPVSGTATGQLPTVTGIAPATGPSAGGTTVTITGTHFYSGATVSFGSTAATNATVVSLTSITAASPAGSSAVDVTVTTGVGTSGTSGADTFTYASADVTTTAVAVSPSAIPAGQMVTVTATVADSTNGGTTPTGSVTFTDTVGSTTTNLNSGNPVSLASGVATLSSVTLSGAGAHTIAAAYGGVGGSLAGSSGSSTVAVSAVSNVGTAAAPFPVTLTFTAAGTVSTIKVLTQGAPNLDFTDAVSGDSCSGAYSVAGTCTVNVVFTPRYPGLRSGAVQLADSSGNILATAYVHGVGTAPQIFFSKNNVKTTLGSFNYPISIALDGSANVFLADTNVREIVAAGGYATVHTLGGGFGFVQLAGVALDGAGNLIVADYGNSQVDQVMAKGGYTTVNVLATYPQFTAPNGLAVDGSGNIFVTDQVNGAVYEMVAASGYATVNTLAGGFSNPNGVAVDGSGNVYLADTGHNAVKELVAVAGVIPNSPTIRTLGGGFSSPNAVAVGANGAVFVADSGHSAVKTMPAGCVSSACVSILGGGFSSPFGVALNGNGNLFLVDYLSGLAQQLNFSSPPSLSFPNTNVGANSSATALSIANGGNAALSLAASGLNAPDDYLQVAGSGTPVDCANSSSVASGASCNLSIAFKPVSGGPHAESFGLTDNNRNVTGATQTIPLSGTGVALPVKLALSGVPAQILSGANLGTATVDVESAGSSVVTTSSASITVAVTGPGGFSQAVTGAAVNGVFSANLGSVVLSATGSYTVTATSSNLTSAIAAVTVAKATATITLGNLAQTYTGSPLSATATTNPASLTVGFTYNGSATPPGTAGSYTVVATINNQNYAGTATGALVIAKAEQSISFTPLASPVNYITPIALSATGVASGNPVVFTVLSGPGSVSGSQLIVFGPGTLVIAANQSGSANYAAAPQVTQTVVSVASNLASNVTALHFGNVPLGTASPSQTVIVSNPNGYPVTGATFAASGDFSAASNCPTIAGLGACSINVTFTPTASGTRSGTLTAGDAQWSGQLSAVLSGTGTAPGIQFSTAALDFGSVLSSTTSVGQTVTIQNTGTTSLIVSKVATTGDFSATGNCAVIQAGSNCSLSVTFTPTALGARTGTVTLTDNVGGSTGSQTINLAGMGAPAGVTLTPSAAAFPSTLAGSTGFLINATLTNTGTAPLTGIGVSILGDFTQTNTCQGTLAAGSTCIVSVKYAPTVAGAGSGTLTVIDNLGSQIASLAGTGVVPGASLSSSQLMFGGQLINTSSLAQTVVFANTGSTAVNIGSVVTSSNFTDSTNCTGSVAPGASCSVNVIFTPTAIGPLSGTVTITDGAGTQVVSLEGQGTQPGLAVSPSFEIFGAQVAGTTSQAQTLTVTNTGTAALTLNPITVSNNLVESDQCPTIFQPGANCTVSLSFSPTSTGTLSGSMVISDATGLVSTMVTATGQGTLPGIATSPSTLSFGSLSVGTTSQGQTVTVTNTGTAPLQIGVVSGTGDFAETDTCSSQTIAAGGYCVISVTMTPTTVGTRTGAVQFNDSVDGLHMIALSGMGQQAGVSVTPTGLAFGSSPIVSSAQASSAAGTSLSVTISNTGGAPLELGGFSTQGDFTGADNCGASVAAASTCTLTVKFAPTALGHRTGTLTITDNAGGGAQRVSLEGDGSPAGLILTPPVINFGVQPMGATSKVQTATLSNNTGTAISDLAILASGEYSETDNCGIALANGASCTVRITVTPATTGAITGTVAISGGGVFATAAPSIKTPREAAGYTSASSISNVGVVATLASTNGNATASQLAFGSTPTPVITAGGNAGSSITVLENDSKGNMVGAADTITLTVTSPSGTAKTYAATASGGIATFNSSGNALTAAGIYSYSVAVASNASIKSATAGLTVNAGAAASVVPTAGSGQSSLTNVAFGTPLQVVVTDSYGNPVSGVNVTFAVPAAGASATLSSNSVKTGAAGAANVTATANGTAGVYTVTAAASGATLASFSLTNSQVQSSVDFSLNPGNVNGQGPSQTVIPGGTATYSLAIVPTSGTTLPASTTLTLTGMPAGATASVPTSSWTRLANNSWSFPANTSFTGFALTIRLPSATALLSNKDAPTRKIPPVLWGILLLPFACGMRRSSKRLGKAASILMMMLVGLTAAVALSGCGSSNGFFGQPQKTYTVTVTATSGTLSHSTNLTLIVE